MNADTAAGLEDAIAIAPSASANRNGAQHSFARVNRCHAIVVDSQQAHNITPTIHPAAAAFAAQLKSRGRPLLHSEARGSGLTAPRFWVRIA